MSPDAFSPAPFPRLRPLDAPAEYEQELRRGYAQGHAEGYRTGMAAADAERARAEHERAERAARQENTVTNALAALEEAARLLHERIQQLSGVATDGIHHHAIELAEHIIARELGDARVAAESAMQRAVREADRAPVPLEILLHPQDLDLIRSRGDDDTGVLLRADPALSPGDAVVVLQDGLIDARVGQALDRARTALTERTR